MIHYGDIKTLSGSTLPPEDVIISGFTLLWEQINGNGSCLWASEIEPFCVAVTRKRFGGTKDV